MGRMYDNGNCIGGPTNAKDITYRSTSVEAKLDAHSDEIATLNIATKEQIIANYDSIKSYIKGGTASVHFNGFSVTNGGVTTYIPHGADTIRLLVYDNLSRSIIRVNIISNGTIELLSASGSSLASATLYGDIQYRVS